MKHIYILIAVFVLQTALSQNVNIPDTNFKSALINLGIDANSDGEIQESEALSVTNLGIQSENISSLEGIEYFTNLTTLNFYDNNITTVNLNSLTNLTYLNCANNELELLDLSNLAILSYVQCKNNLLTSLDGSSNDIHYLYCENNQLAYINLKDGLSGGNYYTYFEGFYDYRFDGNPIEYICVDDFGYESQYLSGYNTGTYCSFVPGGDYYTFEGTTRLDIDNNGCDVFDIIYPYLKFNITDGNNNSNFISSASGAHSFPVTVGVHTISPDLEHPDYFTTSPSSVTADFPTDASPFVQDFCITPNGDHNDLEITILPLNAARPGFGADYKINYKNKGTTTLSGTVDLTFDDDLMNLVSSNPTTDSQTINNLSWNYSSLLPFESREILVTMNLNTPTDTPPLNGDDILDFTATVNPVTGDETTDDNIFTLNQTVVNSYDPNDKTCLEGNTVEPDMIGEFVHYLVRFENTGTANAINIVVKDIIDAAKFDISTLYLTDSSHDLVTRINDNVVEFIFENINLPFDDANNDGYIAFKIKTLNTLVEGDTFENDAEIFFDYNFPINTNVAQTNIQSPLSINDFESLNSFEIYPNPSQDKLSIKVLEGIRSVTIYDISGRLINQISFIGNRNNIDISTEKLVHGTYLVRVKTDVGEFVKKIVNK